MRLQKRAIERFENQLDIRKLVSTQVDVNILLNILFNQKQMFLFRHQHERVFAQLATTNKEDQQTVTESENEIDKSAFAQNLVTSKTMRSYQKEINQLEGFKVESNVDRNLVLGLYQKPVTYDLPASSTQHRPVNFAKASSSSSKNPVPW